MSTIAATDIECPRCHRISFSWEPQLPHCAECRWTIRPVHIDKPYGCDVLVEVRAANILTTTKEHHYKGNEATARRRARNVPGFVRVLGVAPLSEEVWIRAYGEGRL